ncbi:MAG: hypothetical protein ABIP67_16245 [Burkholderiales bacterium]
MQINIKKFLLEDGPAVLGQILVKPVEITPCEKPSGKRLSGQGARRGNP